jgi:hypothetical protein
MENAETIKKGLIGSMPLQFSSVRDMPLQKLNLEKCHSNFHIQLVENGPNILGH